MLLDRKLLERTKFLFVNFLKLIITVEAILLAENTLAQETIQLPISVKSIEILGNTIFPDSELEAIVAPLIGQEISLETLLQVQKKIDNHYQEKGYIGSRSLLLPQELNERVYIQIIEGTLETVQIKGNRHLSNQYIKARLPEEGKPLNVNHLYRSLNKLQKDPLIAEIEAEITQGNRGKNILLLELTENSPWKAQFALTDAYSPSIGNFGGNASISHLNLLGFGDRLNLTTSQTEGLSRIGGSYSFPFNRFDGRITFFYSNANSELVEKEVEDFDIQADFESFELNLSQPIISTDTESFVLGIALELIDSETFVLEDLSFTFTEGLPDGKSQLSIIKFSQEYVKNGTSTLLVTSSRFNLGIDAFDATLSKRGIDGVFWSWNGDFQWLKAFNEERDLVLATSLNLQLTPAQLLPVEQITIGGLGRGTGYRPNLGIGDNGVISTLELRIPVLRGNWGKIQVIPFFHLGNIWNNKRETTGSTNTFASSGLTLRYGFKEAFELRLDYGIPIIEARGFGATDTEDNFSASVLVYPLQF